MMTKSFYNLDPKSLKPKTDLVLQQQWLHKTFFWA